MTARAGWFRRLVLPGFAFKAVVIGGGYATGRELAEFFLPQGAEAFRRDIPNAVLRFFDTGHFALETHAAEIAAAIRDFLPRQ